MNGQPWHFIAVRDRETLRRLGSLAPNGRYVAQATLSANEPTHMSVIVVGPAEEAMAAWRAAAPRLQQEKPEPL